MSNTKQCTICSEIKVTAEFYKNRKKCKSCYKKLNEKYYKNNKQRIIQKAADWVAANRQKSNKYKIRHHFKKLKSDQLYKIKHNARKLICEAFRRKNFKKHNRTEKILGCSFEQFKAHIESKFKPGMSWENRSEWHIDHIQPLALAKTEEQVAKLCHYTNLQPLWAHENLAKGAKISY